MDGFERMGFDCNSRIRARLGAWFSVLQVIFVLSLLGLPPLSPQAAEKRYVVKKNDTLSTIANRYGVKLSALIKRNSSVRPDRIFPGEVIWIPGLELSDAGPSLNSSIRKAIDRTRVRPGRWKHIVIHHSATDSGTAKGMDRYHREERHMENGLAYHFVIGNGKGMGDGEIAIGDRWTKQLQGGHLASLALNENSIGVCLVGNFDSSRPTKKQFLSLEALTAHLMKRSHLSVSAVKTHQQINPIGTRCPGDQFPLDALLKELKSL